MSSQAQISLYSPSPNFAQAHYGSDKPESQHKIQVHRNPKATNSGSVSETSKDNWIQWSIRYKGQKSISVSVTIPAFQSNKAAQSITLANHTNQTSDSTTQRGKLVPAQAVPEMIQRPQTTPKYQNQQSTPKRISTGEPTSREFKTANLPMHNSDIREGKASLHWYQ
jgi:hypothetical protein